MRSWWRHNKKDLNAGEMKEDRIAQIDQLLEVCERYRLSLSYLT